MLMVYVFAVKFYCVQHSGLQKLTRPGGSRDMSDYARSCVAQRSQAGPGMVQ